MALAVGAHLQDSRYQIQQILKVSDVEVAYQALHTYLARSVVLKELRSDLAWVAGAQPSRQVLMSRVKRFSHCRHACLGEVLDCFEEGDRVYLVLSTAPNPNLEPTVDQWLHRHGPVAPHAMLDYLKPLVEAVSHLHRQDMVYGEWTPQSLHYRTTTHELVMDDIGWRMVLADLVGDRQSIFTTPATDTHGLARLAYSLLTAQPLPADRIAQPAIRIDGTQDYFPSLRQTPPGTDSLLKDILTIVTTPVEALDLKPTEWFIRLQIATLAPPPPSGPYTTSTVQGASESDVGNIATMAPSPITAEEVPPMLTNQPNNPTVLQQPNPTTIQPPNPTILQNPSSTTLQKAIDPDPPAAPSGRSWSLRQRWLPYWLGATSIVTVMLGGLLGYAFRVQDAEQLKQSPLFGNELFGSDQAFPPSDYWPGSEHDDLDASGILFEPLPNQRTARPVNQTNINTNVNSEPTQPRPIDQGWGDDPLDELAPLSDHNQGLGQTSGENNSPENLGTGAPTTDNSPIITPADPNQPVVDSQPKPRIVEPVPIPDSTPRQPPAPSPAPTIEPQAPAPRVDDLPPVEGRGGAEQQISPQSNSTPKGSDRVIPSSQP